MLQKLSDGAKGGISKFILVGFLFMAVAGLVLTDVGGFFRDGVSSTNVAEVGSQPVPYNEFDRFLRSSLAQQGMTPQEAFQVGQINAILQRYTQDLLFVQGAQKLGVRTPDEAVATELHRFVKPHLDGQTTPQEALDQLLRQQGLSEQNFVDAIRRDLTSNILKQAVLSGVETAPPLLSKELMRYQKEQRDITYIKLPHEGINIEIPPSEKELEEFYNVSQAEYRIPERRGFQIALLDPKTLIEGVEVAEEDIQTFYDQNKDRYEVPGGLKVEQAVFSTETDANTFIEGLGAPDNFKQAAGDNYRSENVFQEENTPEALSGIIFPKEEEPAPVRGPAQSPLGWHVIRELGNVDAGYRSYEDVKETIRLLLKREQERDVLYEAMETINDQIDDGTALNVLVDEYQMETLSVPPVDQFGQTKEDEDGLKSFEEDKALLSESAFDLYEEEVSEMIELEDGRFALLKLETLTEESVKPFEAVRDQIKTRLIDTQQRAENQIAAQTYFQKLQSGDIDLENIAKENNTTLQTENNVSRTPSEEEDTENKDIPPNLRARIFNNDPGTTVMAPTADGFILAQSSNQRLAKQDVTEETESLARQMTIIGTLSTYYDYLAEQIPVKYNQQLLNQLYGQPQG